MNRIQKKRKALPAELISGGDGDGGGGEGAGTQTNNSALPLCSPLNTFHFLYPNHPSHFLCHSLFF